ncbi:polyamine aminopropyltransferase [Sansalvadorimonas sp. 2012CJ34-2]|uniref:Polyamine aminopropyltransferase n=1 Tax=Parendozoicomonas callyspongiae TaxID=2942213 RepID=A0ABT0PC86_9GAMM|nr:polyamine aminopropyltransferase [Sansalvadorimonas sp. 2012CJ34-2]MCL6268997.1 polyamine aminopropyltransferase [Sansalvadorimonas sp. 2012CJ34-2]
MKIYSEKLHPGYAQQFDMEEILFEQTTGQQQLVIFKNKTFGTVMALDGIIQTTECDEFIYHEMLTHVPILAHGNVKSVLIIGGGDGGILREVCRHQCIEEITQVEIDHKVIDMCREFLPGHSNGAFDDPRANIVIADGCQFVEQTSQTFDIIISDSTDPVGPGEVLFTNTFYENCKRCLNPDGILVTQNGVAYLQRQEVITTARRLGSLFTHTAFYSAAVPTYVGGIMCFAWASDNPAHATIKTETISQRFEQSQLSTRYYTPDIHRASFALPRYILDAIKG